jgi:hypothetical protein
MDKLFYREACAPSCATICARSRAILAVSIANIKSYKIAKIRICEKVVSGLLSKRWYSKTGKIMHDSECSTSLFPIVLQKSGWSEESCLLKMCNTCRMIGRNIESTVSVLSYIVSYTSDERLVVICLYQVIVLKHEQASMSLVIYYLVKEKSWWCVDIYIYMNEDILDFIKATQDNIIILQPASESYLW